LSPRFDDSDNGWNNNDLVGRRMRNILNAFGGYQFPMRRLIPFGCGNSTVKARREAEICTEKNGHNFQDVISGDRPDEHEKAF